MDTDERLAELASEYVALSDDFESAWDTVESSDDEVLNRFGEEHDDQSDRLDAIEAEVLAATPTTLRGFAAKATVGLKVLEIHHGRDSGLDPTFDIISRLCAELKSASGI